MWITYARDLHMLAMAFVTASLGFGFLRPGYTAGASVAVGENEQAAVAGCVTATNGGATFFPSAPHPGVEGGGSRRSVDDFVD